MGRRGAGRRTAVVALALAAVTGCGGNSRCVQPPPGDGVRVQVSDDLTLPEVTGYRMALCVDGPGCRDLVFDGPTGLPGYREKWAVAGVDGLSLPPDTDIAFAVSVYAPDGRLLAERQGAREVDTWREDCGRRVLRFRVDADGISTVRENGR